MKKKIIFLIILTVALGSDSLASQKNNRLSLADTFIGNFSLRLSASLQEKSPDGPEKKISFSFDDRWESSPFLSDPEKFKRITSPPKHKLRGFVEFFSLFAYSGINYNIKYGKFIEDWQYRFTWKDQKRRFFTLEAQQFDSNNFGLNWRHSLAGMIYYEFARSNNLTWWQSALYSVGGSLAWEYMVEWREVISINDNLMTGPGGVVLGESWFQLGKYFFNSPHKFTRILSWLNPFMKINGWFDRKHPLPPYFHSYNPQAQDVYFFIGYRQSPTSTRAQEVSNLDISFNSRIITRQDYGIPGKVKEKFNQPIYSQLDLEMMYHGKNREELDLMAKVVPLGWFAQNISDDKKGYSYYYGLGSALEVYVKRPVVDYDAEKFAVNQPDEFHFETPRDFRDKLGAIHLIGPVFDLVYFARPWYFRLGGEAYLSFGMINSLPLNKYSIDHDIRGMKTTLTYFGYYYALGPALKYRVNLGYNHLRLEGFLEYLYYHSLQGRDRFQNDLLDDSPLKDSRWHYGLGLQYQIPDTSLSIESRLEWVKRWGIIHEIEDHNLEKRLYLGLKISL